MSAIGTMKPTSEDFVSLPPPPPEVAFSSPSQHTVATPRVFGNSQTATRSHTWQPQVQDLPLPPPPEDLPQPPPSSDYVKPSFLPAEKPKGFRSVARPVVKKPTNSNNAKEETITKYSIQGKPFPAPPSTAAEITPKEQLPDGAVYQTVSKEGNVVHTDTYFPAADQNQSDPVVLERTKTTTIVQAPHHQGIGPVNDKGVPYALRSTVDDSKHWYKNMFKQMHKIEPGEETTKPSETPPQHNSGSNVSTVSHTSTEIPKPTKVGRIFDYQPAEPYVVENTPVKLNLNRRVNYESERSKSVNSNNNNNKGGTAVNTAQLSSSSDTSNETSSSPAPVKSYSPSYTATSQHKMPETKKTTTTSGKVAQKPSKESDMRLPARGKFDFTAQTAKEYPLKKGHTVIITKQVDSNWYMVESVDGSKSGIVPVAYVEVVSGSSPEKPLRNGQARAKFDYTGTTKAELSFKKGDEIILLKRVDDNWFKGKLGNSTGILPVVYVEVIKEPESEPKKANQPTLSNQPQQTSPPRHSAASSLNAPAHSHQSSTLSQASSDEPDESERKNRAAFLANSVVGSKTSLHSRDSSTHREDILDHPELISESEVSQPQKVSLTANEPAQALDLSELNEVVEALSSGDKHPSNIAQPSPANNHLSPQSSALTPSIPSYPSSNISTQPSSPRLQTPPAMDFGQVIGRYVALYAYVASNDDELDLMPGDIVMVVETCDDGWYVGTCQRSGAFGTFPGNYVSLTNT